MTRVDTLILTFAKRRSLSHWAALGRLDREKKLLAGFGTLADRLLFVCEDGPDDAEIARSLTAELGVPIDAISKAHDDPELGEIRPLAQRVLARLDGDRRVVIQTMQFQDGGLAASLIGPMRRAGIQAALIARGACVRSRDIAASRGPHSYDAQIAGADEQALCRIAQLVAGASTSMLDDLCWRHGINPARTRVIPHFVTEDHAAVPAAERDPHRVLVVGGLEPGRGIDTVLAALARLPDPVKTKVRLDIVGDGPDRPRLEHLAAENSVNADFAGRLPHAEVFERMRTCAVFVHASPVRCQSRSVLEAMATGCPVIVTDTPEFDGLVENASTGVRVKPTEEHFALAIEAVLSDTDWREMLGSAAARTIRMTCGLERVLDLCGRAFDDALALAPESVPARPRRAG